MLTLCSVFPFKSVLTIGIIVVLVTVACAPSESEIRNMIRDELATSLVEGPQGPAGPKGEQGEPGTQGATGMTGARGPTGVMGESGAQGTQGDRGPQGERGPAGPVHSYAVAYSEGMEHLPAVPDYVVPLPDIFRVEGIEDTYFFEWAVPDKGDPHYSGSLPSDGQLWQLYPPHANNPSRTDGFCDAETWTALFVTESGDTPWYYCDERGGGSREGLATVIARQLDEAKGLSSRLHIYQAYDWE